MGCILLNFEITRNKILLSLSTRANGIINDKLVIDRNTRTGPTERRYFELKLVTLYSGSSEIGSSPGCFLGRTLTVFLQNISKCATISGC